MNKKSKQQRFSKQRMKDNNASTNKKCKSLSLKKEYKINNSPVNSGGGGRGKGFGRVVIAPVSCPRG